MFGLESAEEEKAAGAPEKSLVEAVSWAWISIPTQTSQARGSPVVGEGRAGLNAAGVLGAAKEEKEEEEDEEEEEARRDDHQAEGATKKRRRDDRPAALIVLCNLYTSALSVYYSTV